MEYSDENPARRKSWEGSLVDLGNTYYQAYSWTGFLSSAEADMARV